MAVDAKNHGGWIGRSIRRLEDPALVAGHGRFTGDLPAARWIRFVRSSVASGRIKRFVGEPIAAVVSAAREEAEDVADLVEVEIEELPALVGAGAALARGAPLVHAEAAGNVVVEGRLKTPGFDAKLALGPRR